MPMMKQNDVPDGISIEMLVAASEKEVMELTNLSNYDIQGVLFPSADD